MKKQAQRGFTLIELMIVVAIIGILAAIAIPAFLEYIGKSKVSEANTQLRAMEEKVKAFHLKRQVMPADAMSGKPGAATAGCGTSSGKIVKANQAAWYGDAGWKEMGFHVDEDSYYSYTWDQISASGAAAEGTGTAAGDIDCNGVVDPIAAGTDETLTVNIKKDGTNLVTTYTP
jgi:type IV pilus assembly protein PilA